MTTSGSMRVIVGEDSDGTVSVSYLPYIRIPVARDEQDDESTPAIPRVEAAKSRMDKRSIKQILRQIEKLAQHGCELLERVEKAERIEREISQIPIRDIRGNLIPGNRSHEASSLVNEVRRRSVSRTVIHRRGNVGVGQVTIDGDAMEVPV